MRKTVLLLTWLLLMAPWPTRAQAPALTVVTEDGGDLNWVVDATVTGPATAVVREMLRRAGVAGQIQVLP